MTLIQNIATKGRRQSTTFFFSSWNIVEVKRDWSWEMLGSILITHLYSSMCLRSFKSEESRDSAMPPPKMRLLSSAEVILFHAGSKTLRKSRRRVHRSCINKSSDRAALINKTQHFRNCHCFHAHQSTAFTL